MPHAIQTDQRTLVEYVGSVPDLEQLQPAVAEIWAQAINANPDLLRPWMRSKTGVYPAPFELKRKQGSHPDLATLIVMAGTSGIHVATMVLHDLWKSVVLPKLKRRFGASWRESAPKVITAPTCSRPPRAKSAARKAKRAKRPRRASAAASKR
jgi:hypothetical protein